MRCARRSVLGFLLVSTCIFAAAQDALPPQDAPVDYTGHALVEVTLNTPAQLEQMLEISQHFWSCSPHLGDVPFSVSPQQMEALRASGLPFRIIEPDIQRMIDHERAALAQRGGPWFENYHPYDEVSDYVNTLVALRPDLAGRISLGQSIQGRDIFGIRITGPGAPPDRPAVLYNGCQHAREWVAVMVPMYIADRLIRTYDTDPQVRALVDSAVFYIVPIVNPDGYVYTWGPDRLWRKNRRNNGGGSYGVDNNRNWGYQWGGSGSSGSPDSETYRGTAPFSEPETAAMRDFIIAHPEIAAHIDFHSYSQLILSPWGYSTGEPPEPDRTVFRTLNDQMAAAILSVHGETYIDGPTGQTLYLAAGCSLDWSYGDQGILAWTIELRPDSANPGFILPASEIIPTCEENFAAITVLTEYVSFLLAFDFPDGLPGYVPSDAGRDLSVIIRELRGSLEPGSPRQFVRVDGGAFVETPLVSLGGDLYQATLPAANCGAAIEYYFQAETTGGSIVRSPLDAPATLHAADVLDETLIFEDDIELDRGWTVGAPGDDATTGIWGRMNPEGTAAQPEDDHTPAPGVICYVTDGRAGTGVGTYDIDGGQTTLLSPVLDLTGSPEAVVSYWRWFSNNQGASANEDIFRIDVTADGANWVNAETVGPAGAEAGGGWYYHEFRVADFVTPSAAVRVRFVAADEGSGSIVEAAVDDFRVASLGCDSQPCPGDLTGDGQRDFDDLLVVLAAYGVNGGGDIDGDGDTDFDDLVALLNVYGTPCP